MPVKKQDQSNKMSKTEAKLARRQLKGKTPSTPDKKGAKKHGKKEDMQDEEQF
jgi:hypothetical protein